MIATAHPYLVANLLALPALAIAFLAAGPQRAPMLASGAIFAPWGACSPLLDEYWSPARIGGGPIGFEDFLISFQTGAAIWFWASLPLRRRLSLSLRLPAMLARASLLAVAFIAAAAVLHLVGLTGIAQAVTIPPLAAAAILARRPNLWPLAAAATIGYTTTYAILLQGLFLLLPALAGEWRESQWWTTTLAGLPIGELIWASVGAPSHALCFAVICDATLRPSPRRVSA